MKKTLALLAALALTSHADDAKIKANLEKFGVQNIDISASPMAGIRQVTSDQGIFYASEDGQFYLQGSLVQLTDQGPIDLTYQPLLSKVNAESDTMIVFKAPNEQHVVNVFFDITCHYCKVMYKENKKYNDLGITVRYLAFPRNGLASKSARQMETIWQSDDRKAALDAAEKGQTPDKETRVNIVKRHYDLGAQLGIQGTPAIFTDKGQLISGYLPADDLFDRLENGM